MPGTPFDSFRNMLHCHFTLNDKPMSALTIGGISVPAFSGLGEHANHRAMACMRGTGPIPPGKYYIFDRESGGVLGPLRDLITGRTDWFALYAADGRLDDEAVCEQVKRGNFRLHPKGSLGRSEGCVVVDVAADFSRVRTMLRAAPAVAIPGSKLKTYGTLTVR